MARKAIRLICVAAWAITAAVWAMVGNTMLEERQRVTPAAQVIVDQFAATYCNLHRATSKADAELQTAESAMVSRLAVAAGVGVLARAEYLKCATLRHF
jgi:hypothetical protein